MKIPITSWLILSAFCISLQAAETKPNIVYFLVVDIGYADAKPDPRYLHPYQDGKTTPYPVPLKREPKR